MGTAAQDYLAAAYGGQFSEVIKDVTADVGVAVLRDLDPEAISMDVSNLSANPVYIGVDNKVSATRGFLVAANGGLLSVNVREDGLLPTRRWWCIAPAGASAVLVTTVHRYTG